MNYKALQEQVDEPYLEYGAIPPGRTSHSMLIDNDYIYIFGGSGSSFGRSNLNDVFRFAYFILVI